MTVPNLVSNFRKKQTETGIRVAYKILNDALKMPVVMGKAPNMSAMIENSYASNNNDWEPIINYFATNYLVPYLKVEKTCAYGESETTCGILYPHKQIDGTRVSNQGMFELNQKYRIQLTNGMQIGVAREATSDAELGFSFLVDINGKSGPNRLAYDQFYFEISAEPCSSGNSDSCARHNFIQGGLTYLSRTSVDEFETSINECINNSGFWGSKGVGCAALLQQNGWTIPDNYPVKKW